MILPDRLRLPLRFDPNPLREDLARLESGEWVRHVVRENYDGRWEMLPLRAPAGETHPIRMVYPDPGAKAFYDTTLLEQSPNIRAALEQLDCPLRVVRLMKLAAGSVIKEHSDPFLSAEDGMVRLHVPIHTNPDVDFQVNRNRVIMAPGEMWYLRLTDPHRVANRGMTDRVHLVIDAHVNDWLIDVLRTAAAAEPA